MVIIMCICSFIRIRRTLRCPPGKRCRAEGLNYLSFQGEISELLANMGKTILRTEDFVGEVGLESAFDAKLAADCQKAEIVRQRFGRAKAVFSELAEQGY